MKIRLFRELSVPARRSGSLRESRLGPGNSPVILPCNHLVITL